MNSDLQALQRRIKQFCDDRDWSQFHDPKNMAISLQLETAEVLELFQWSKDNSIVKGKEGQVVDELADVMYWLIKLADYYDIDLLQALNEKMNKNEEKYPVEKAKGVATKYNEL
jgi:dCTP diphosphatase